ncbi:MAG: response regulator, partial [Butyrivibrio sp.]|nr:response regulator [Butyrivibrio sp.]
MGTFLLGNIAGNDTKSAVRNVSLLYLSELAGRREQVVSAALNDYIRDLDTALGLIEAEDLESFESLKAYQLRMKQLYDLDKYAFIDSNGLIYTSRGTRTDIDQYQIDYVNLSEPEISIKNLKSREKKVIIAVPADNLTVEGKTLVVCFMEIDMNTMLRNVSLSSNNNTTFCNIYTETGVVSFNYNGIDETLYYVPVHGTNWMLTYLIRESIIGEQISTISQGIIIRGLIQSILTALVLAGMFVLIFAQQRQSAKAQMEMEVNETENRIKQQELEEQLVMQEELLEQEKKIVEQDNMIDAQMRESMAQREELALALKAAEEANRAKSGFVSNMSHEIRTPITAILGMNEMIRRECTDENILSYAENINAAGVSLLGIISDILDFSKIEAGKIELVEDRYSTGDLISNLYNLIQFRAEAKGIDFTIRADRNLPKGLWGDELRVKQILANLLSNGVKYTEKGSLCLDIRCSELDPENKKVKIAVSVIDTGIGIRPEDMENARKIAVSTDKADQKIFTAPGRRILVVDDTPMNLQVIKGLLKRTRMTVETASGGEECVAMVGERDYDLIFMDYRMP